MDDYSRRSEEALTSFMERVAARGAELEVAAAVRLDQFRGLPATAGLPNINDGPKIAAAADRAVAGGLGVEIDETQKPRSGHRIALIRSEPAA